MCPQAQEGTDREREVEMQNREEFPHSSDCPGCSVYLSDALLSVSSCQKGSMWGLGLCRAPSESPEVPGM